LGLGDGIVMAAMKLRFLLIEALDVASAYRA
jgi:hypothetical protein